MPTLASDEASPLRDNAHGHVRGDMTAAKQCPCSRPMNTDQLAAMPMLTSRRGLQRAPIEGRRAQAMHMLVSTSSNRLLAARDANLTLPTEGQPATLGRKFRELKRLNLLRKTEILVESFEKLVKSPISKDFTTCSYGSLGSAVVSRE